MKHTHKKLLLSKLKDLTVDGVEVLYQGPSGTNTNTSGRVRTIDPCPLAVLLFEIYQNDPAAVVWADAVWHRLLKTGEIKVVPYRPMPTGMFAYTRPVGGVAVVDFDNRTVCAYSTFPGGNILPGYATDPSDFDYRIGITGAGLDALNPRIQTDGDLTASQVAKIMGIDLDIVYGHVKSGRLKATNTAKAGSQRPRWRITMADLESFRQNQSHLPMPKVRKRRRIDDKITRYV